MISPAATLRIVAAHLGVPVEKMIGRMNVRRSREPRFVRARQVAACVLRDAGLSFPEVASAIGWASHKSAVVEIGKARAGADPDLAATIAYLTGRVRTAVEARESSGGPEYAPPGSRRAILAEAARLGEMRDRLLALAESMR